MNHRPPEDSKRNIPPPAAQAAAALAFDWSFITPRQLNFLPRPKTTDLPITCDLHLESGSL